MLNPQNPSLRKPHKNALYNPEQTPPLHDTPFSSTASNSQNNNHNPEEELKLIYGMQEELKEPQQQNWMVSGILSFLCGCCSANSSELLQPEGFLNSHAIASAPERRIMAQRSKGSSEERIEDEEAEPGLLKMKSKPLMDTSVNHQILKKALDNFEDTHTKDQQNDQDQSESYCSEDERLTPPSAMRKRRRRDRNQWSRFEDELLIKAFKKYKTNWSIIASSVNSNKDAKMCRARISQINAEKNRIELLKVGGSWDLTTDQRIHALYKKYGCNWTLIQKQMPGKTAKQIRDRFFNVIQPSFNNMFSRSDDAKILSLFEVYPNDWKKLALYFKGKTPNVIKERYQWLKQKGQKEQKEGYVEAQAKDDGKDNRNSLSSLMKETTTKISSDGDSRKQTMVQPDQCQPLDRSHTVKILSQTEGGEPMAVNALTPELQRKKIFLQNQNSMDEQLMSRDNSDVD